MAFLTTYQNVIVLVFIHAIAGLSMWVVMSQRVISLAGAGFMGIGAYSSAILFTSFGAPLWVSAAVGTLIAGSVAYGVGRPIMRLRTHYLAIASLGFTLVIQVVAINWRQLTGGPHGIYGLSRSTEIANAALVFAGLALILGMTYRSHVGRSMYAVGDDEVVARAFGIPYASFRLWGFVASGMMASVAGSLLAHRIRVVEPAQFGDILAFMLLAYAILGGVRHWVGPAIGASIFVVLPEAVRYFDRYREVMIGVVLLLVMIYLPDGLVQPIKGRRAWNKLMGRTGSEPGVYPVAEKATVDETAPDAADERRQEELVGGGRLRSGGPSAASSAVDPTWVMNNEQGTQPILLDIANVSVSFGGVQALRDVSLQLNQRAGIVGVIGPNGSGKSTLLNVLGGQLEPDHGTVKLDDHDISGWPTEQRAAAGVVRTFQSPRIDSEATVLDCLLVGTSALRRSSAIAQILHTRSAKREEEGYRELAMSLLSRFKLQDKTKLAGAELSFGQQRLIELARCAIASPRVVLLDEPTSGVNPEWFTHIYEIIQSIVMAGSLVILVEHNMEFVEGISQDIVVLDAGEVIARDSMKGLRASEKVMDAYLGVRK